MRLAETVRRPERYRTLFYGLKRNHPRNVAIVHPLMFLLRRIIFALMIVYMDKIAVWSTFIFMFMTLTMLAYALSEH